MEVEDVGALPVVNDDVLVGMVTDRDIVVRAIARGLDPATTRVAEIASEDLVKVNPDHDLMDALNLMARHQVRRLAVTDEDNRLVGVLSQADVVLEAKEKDAGALVGKISKPSSGPRIAGPRPVEDPPRAPTSRKKEEAKGEGHASRARDRDSFVN
jgi:signal-transduction protein with cAMP-binding, CBS, and nucleotidyltransferase domain